MAMVCVTGGRECDGCGRCFPEAREHECPACGATLGETDSVFVIGGEIVGCEYCVREKQAYEVFEEN